MVLLSHSWPLTVAVIVLTSCQSQYRDVNYLSTARLDLLLSQTSGELHGWKKVSSKSCSIPFKRYAPQKSSPFEIQKSCIKILKLSVDQIITIIIFQEYLHIKLLVNKISHLIPETYEGHPNT